MEKVKVNIGGKTLELAGENSELIAKSAQLVDDQISSMKKIFNDEPDTTTLTILAALNIAEKQIISQQLLLNDKEIVLDRINSLAKKFESIANG